MCDFLIVLIISKSCLYPLIYTKKEAYEYVPLLCLHSVEGSDSTPHWYHSLSRNRTRPLIQSLQKAYAKDGNTCFCQHHILGEECTFARLVRNPIRKLLLSFKDHNSDTWRLSREHRWKWCWHLFHVDINRIQCNIHRMGNDVLVAQQWHLPFFYVSFLVPLELLYLISRP